MLIKREIVYRSDRDVSVWNQRGEYYVKVITYIVKTKFLWFSFYRIKQVLPLVDENDIFSSYESSSNSYLKCIGEEEKGVASLELLKQIYKNDK